jgi:hypothetical protein
VQQLTHAEKAKSLLERIHNGVLATTHFELGHPYASTVNLAMDEKGRPYTFMSTMAEHTTNIRADTRCSVLVHEQQGQGDQLANARLTLVGHMVHVSNDDPAYKQCEEGFLANHPGAYYVEFDDFSCYRLEIEAIRYIGGFGEMSWVSPTQVHECKQRVLICVCSVCVGVYVCACVRACLLAWGVTCAVHVHCAYTSERECRYRRACLRVWNLCTSIVPA